jgi:hypothetical protein
VGRVTVGAVSCRTRGLMWTHCSPLGLGLRTYRDCGPLVGEERVILVTGITRTMRAAAAAGITRKCGRRVQLAAAMTGRGEPDSTLISAAMAG